MSRYVVTEIKGWSVVSVGSGPPGISCHVIDTAWNRRLVASYRTEDLPNRSGRDRNRATVRSQAHEHAARLNDVRL